MKTEHPIADEILHLARAALSNGETWMAYNNALRFVEKEDVFFFATESEARDFAQNNISDYDDFSVIQLHCVDDILKRIPYGEALSKEISQSLTPETTVTENSIYSQQKMPFMNKEVFEFLADNVKFAGFGEHLKADLEKNIRESKPEFQLHFATEFNKKPFELR